MSYILTSVRTPFGRYGKALRRVRPDDMTAHLLQSLMTKLPGLDAGSIDDVYWGNSNGAGEDSRNVGRMGVLLSQLGVSTPATTINRLCGSSLDAALMASRTIECGDADVVIVGGVESMTRAPWVMPKPEVGFPTHGVAAESSTLGWRFVNPAMPKEWVISLGEANELIADRFGISRDRQDEFALRSHRLAARAWADGHYAPLVDPLPGIDLAMDENVRLDASTESLSQLRPVFRSNGSITAGNASPLSDGAAAIVLSSERAVPTNGAPVGRIAGRGVSANDPNLFGIAPIEAANVALKRAGVGWNDIGAVEINEAFAVQTIACVDAWRVDPEIVNAWGGAIAIGHPLGASGARLIGTLCARLQDTGERWGVAAICVGLGQGIAVVIENVNAGLG